MDTANQTLVVRSIVSDQVSIIGPMAIDEANRVNGLHVSSDLSSISSSGDFKNILSDLVKRYEQLFGQASIEACRESIKKILPIVNAREIPSFLT